MMQLMSSRMMVGVKIMMQKYDNINMYHMMSIASAHHGGQQLVFRTIMLSLVPFFSFLSNWIQFGVQGCDHQLQVIPIAYMLCVGAFKCVACMIFANDCSLDWNMQQY